MDPKLIFSVTAGVVMFRFVSSLDGYMTWLSTK